MKIQLIRHATLLLWINGLKFLVDPLLASKGAYSPVEKVANQNTNPLTELPVSIDELIDCDAVIVTHLHRDHFDSEAAKRLPKSTPILCQPEDEKQLLAYGFTCIHAISDYLCFRGIYVYRIGGKHGRGVVAQKMAPVSGFVLQPPLEPSLYLMGDTIWCRCVKDALFKYNPAFAVCNCGKAEFVLGGRITMGKEDIQKIRNTAPDTKMICVHMETWNHCTLDRQELKNFVKTHVLTNISIPDDGECLEC